MISGTLPFQKPVAQLFPEHQPTGFAFSERSGDGFVAELDFTLRTSGQ